MRTRPSLCQTILETLCAEQTKMQRAAVLACKRSRARVLMGCESVQAKRVCVFKHVTYRVRERRSTDVQDVCRPDVCRSGARSSPPLPPKLLHHHHQHRYIAELESLCGTTQQPSFRPNLYSRVRTTARSIREFPLRAPSRAYLHASICTRLCADSVAHVILFATPNFNVNAHFPFQQQHPFTEQYARTARYSTRHPSLSDEATICNRLRSYTRKAYAHTFGTTYSTHKTHKNHRYIMLRERSFTDCSRSIEARVRAWSVRTQSAARHTGTCLWRMHVHIYRRAVSV